MKTLTIWVLSLVALFLFAAPLLAQEKCGKEIINYNPPPEAYKKVSPDEARNMNISCPSDQKEISITLERVSDKTEDRDEK